MPGRSPIPIIHKLDPDSTPRVMIYDYHQDDPRKCTSAKLERLHLVETLRTLRQIPRSAIVLDPISNKTISFEDRSAIEEYGLVGLDCSWNRADTIFEANIRGEHRRLPTLLAGNPTNYSIRGRLSTAEALSAALMIAGFDKRALELLGSFKWGETFLTLNREPLKEYAKTPAQLMLSCERQFFPTE